MTVPSTVYVWLFKCVIKDGHELLHSMVLVAVLLI
jgi:hypothetical protein